jgi:hypothetical protein
MKLAEKVMFGNSDTDPIHLAGISVPYAFPIIG